MRSSSRAQKKRVECPMVALPARYGKTTPIAQNARFLEGRAASGCAAMLGFFCPLSTGPDGWIVVSSTCRFGDPRCRDNSWSDLCLLLSQATGACQRKMASNKRLGVQTIIMPSAIDWNIVIDLPHPITQHGGSACRPFGALRSRFRQEHDHLAARCSASANGQIGAEVGDLVRLLCGGKSLTDPWPAGCLSFPRALRCSIHHLEQGSSTRGCGREDCATYGVSRSKCEQRRGCGADQ
jgi:hypothetical protein